MATDVQAPIRQTPEKFVTSSWTPKEQASTNSVSADNGCIAPGRNFDVKVLTKADAPRVLAFLRRFFFRDEPLNIAVQLQGPSGDEPCGPLEEYCAEALDEPYSLAAVSPSTGELMGVCLNGTNLPCHADNAAKRAEECPHPRFRRILRLLSVLERRADFFSRFPDMETLMEVRVVSVDSRTRGMGIATTLIQRTTEMARERGFPLVRCDCTSAFSARAVDKLGFKPVCELLYSEYLDEDGKPVFVPEPPHYKVTCYIYEIQALKSK